MKVIVYIFFLALSISLSAQSEYDTYGSVNKKAKKCYDAGIKMSQKGDHNRAIEHFNKSLKKYPDFIDALLQRASVYYEKEDYSKAIEGFNEVLSLDSNYNAKIYYTLGQACYKSGDYVCAEEKLSRYLSTNPKNKILVARAKANVGSAQAAMELSQSSYEIELDPLPETINTEHSEYLPSFSLDGRTLIFTRRINMDEDFYSSEMSDGKWTKAKPIDFINTSNNEGAQCLSADGRLLIFTACSRRDGHGSCDLYYSFKRDGNWVAPKNMGEEINTPGWESQPSLSSDGQTLYFSSNRAGGQGGNDIWISKKAPEGYFDTPINIGDQINTPKNEFAPFIHADDQTLYFTSDGHPGFGNTDLFMSTRMGEDKWESPINLGAPINTHAAEGALTISSRGDTAYFARTQKEAVGQEMDIFSFVLPEKLRPTPVTYIEAIVKNLKSEEVVSDAILILVDNNTGEELLRRKSKSDGSFLIALPLGKDYAFRVEQKDYMFYSDRFELDKVHQKEEPYVYEVFLNPIVQVDSSIEGSSNEPVVLKNVFFESNKFDLLSTSIPELEVLFRHLINYPELNIQINGHTDNVGEDQDNLILSEKRAQAVYQYLIDKGISTNRLSYKGYGETQPIAGNESESGRSQNRRTTFIITK